jgi:hypothetical protein
MPVGYLSEIETHKKPGSIAAFKSLARALQTEIDMLVTELKARSAVRAGWHVTHPAPYFRRDSGT